MAMLLSLLQQVGYCFISLKEKSEANKDVGSEIQTESPEERPPGRGWGEGSQFSQKTRQTEREMDPDALIIKAQFLR